MKIVARLCILVVAAFLTEATGTLLDCKSEKATGTKCEETLIETSLYTNVRFEIEFRRSPGSESVQQISFFNDQGNLEHYVTFWDEPKQTIRVGNDLTKCYYTRSIPHQSKVTGDKVLVAIELEATDQVARLTINGKDPMINDPLLSPYKRNSCHHEPKNFAKMVFTSTAPLELPVHFRYEIESELRERLPDEITPASIESSNDSADVANAIDMDLATKTTTSIGADSRAWLKVKLDKVMCIHNVVMYWQGGQYDLTRTCTSADCSQCVGTECYLYTATVSTEGKSADTLTPTSDCTNGDTVMVEVNPPSAFWLSDLAITGNDIVVPRVKAIPTKSLVSCKEGKKGCKINFKVTTTDGSKITKKNVQICELKNGVRGKCKKGKGKGSSYEMKFGKNVEDGDYICVVTLDGEEYVSDAISLQVV